MSAFSYDMKTAEEAPDSHWQFSSAFPKLRGAQNFSGGCRNQNRGGAKNLLCLAPVGKPWCSLPAFKNRRKRLPMTTIIGDLPPPPAHLSPSSRQWWMSTVEAFVLSSAARTAFQCSIPYRSGRSRDWIKSKNPAAPAVKREAEEDWR
jgi:hypothetical protein